MGRTSHHLRALYIHTRTHSHSQLGGTLSSFFTDWHAHVCGGGTKLENLDKETRRTFNSVPFFFYLYRGFNNRHCWGWWTQWVKATYYKNPWIWIRVRAEDISGNFSISLLLKKKARIYRDIKFGIYIGHLQFKCISDEQARSDSGKENPPEVIGEKNLKRNQT